MYELQSMQRYIYKQTKKKISNISIPLVPIFQLVLSLFTCYCAVAGNETLELVKVAFREYDGLVLPLHDSS
jgi:hypothetical protein